MAVRERGHSAEGARPTGSPAPRLVGRGAGGRVWRAARRAPRRSQGASRPEVRPGTAEVPPQSGQRRKLSDLRPSATDREAVRGWMP
jgi:hypothetical protein